MDIHPGGSIAGGLGLYLSLIHIFINADKVKLTGNKWNDKVYLSYTGYPGGQREITPALSLIHI